MNGKNVILGGNALLAVGLWAATWYLAEKKNATAAAITGILAGVTSIGVITRAAKPQPVGQSLSPYLRSPAGLIGMNPYYTQPTGYQHAS